MHLLRLLAAGSAAALIALTATGPAASAQDAVVGGGTTALSATALSLEIGSNGDVLAVHVLTETSNSNIDPAKGAPLSGVAISPLTVTSKTVPALNLTAPGIATSSSGPEQTTTQEYAVPDAPGLTGTITAGLSSIVDAAGARSGATAGLGNLNLAGLASAPNAVVQAVTDAAPGQSGSSYTITIPEVTVLDLDGVLEAVGLEVTDLSFETINDLLTKLGLELPNLPEPAEAVAVLNDAIDTLQDESGPLTDEVCTTVDNILGTIGQLIDDLPLPDIDDIGNGLPLPDLDGDDDGNVDIPDTEDVDDVVDDIADEVDDVVDPPVDLPDLPLMRAAALEDIDCDTITKTAEQLLDDVQGALSKLLETAVVELADTALLAVKDVKIAVQSVANGDPATSLADVTASIGNVTIGGVNLVSGLDLADGQGVLAQVSDAVNGAIDEVLGIVNSQLQGIVDVELLAIDEQVGKAGEYVTSLASLTAVKATITPPTALFGAAAVSLTDPISGVIGGLGGTVPGLSALTSEVEAALGGLELLSAPAVLTVGQVQSASAFRPGAVQPLPGQSVTPGTPTGSNTPGGDLPRTGGNAALPAVAGVGLGGVAMVLRRYLKRAMS